MGYVFENYQYANKNTFLSEFKYRAIYYFKQDLLDSLGSPVSMLYDEFKISFEYENYLDVLPKSIRFHFCRLIMSSHPFKIQTGRFSTNRIVREEMYCMCCNSCDIEDEYHCMLICPCYNDVRKKYILSLSISSDHQYKES
jgi:hypothetical protein